MPLLIRAAALVFCASLWVSSASVSAGGFGETPQQREGAAAAAAAPAADGKEILTRKCFQCHQASMWTSLRGDRRAWEGVLYRMVGRGALWTEAEINAMAAFLAQTRGPK
jgi:cytochrome c5